MDSELGGLFSITLSDSEPEETTKTEPPRDRTGQSEEAYQAVRRDYRAKVENGEVHNIVKLPVEKGAKKNQIQDVLYAAEELYFFRRYSEATDFLQKVLKQGEGQSHGFDEETRALLVMFLTKCQEKSVR